MMSSDNAEGPRRNTEVNRSPANGNIIADSGEGYASKQGVKLGISSVKQDVSRARFEDFFH